MYRTSHNRLNFVLWYKCLQMVRFSFAAKMQMEMLGLFKASSVFIDIHRGWHWVSLYVETCCMQRRLICFHSACLSRCLSHATDHYTAIQWLVRWPLMDCLLHLVQWGGPGRAAAPSSSLLAVPNVTAHPSTASVPTSYRLMWHCSCLWIPKRLNYVAYK